MSFEDPDRRARGRRRHASVRRGRGAVWLAAVGGAAVLGLGAVALTGGGGSKRPAERETDGGGLPALIRADPAESGTTPPAPSRGAILPPAPAPSTAPAPGPSSSAPSAPSGPSAPAPAGATDPTAAPAPSGDTPADKPGRGRGNGKGPR
ncbi:hypothetical protein [Streptomyces omiyaensis]|uniref:Uncharacterized protein n=1 Tax=Streptomyces omiyaensis TaxID=68247 RepID=A0ABW7C1M6_9ACTN